MKRTAYGDPFSPLRKAGTKEQDNSYRPFSETSKEPRKPGKNQAPIDTLRKKEEKKRPSFLGFSPAFLRGERYPRRPSFLGFLGSLEEMIISPSPLHLPIPFFSYTDPLRLCVEEVSHYANPRVGRARGL